MDTKDQLNTAEEVIESNNAVIEEAAAKVKEPIIKNMAEKIYFDLGAYNIPASFWYKAPPYEHRYAHQGKREMARRQKRGTTQNVDFVPKPSHPNQLVRPADIPSRQVLRRRARQEGLR